MNTLKICKSTLSTLAALFASALVTVLGPLLENITAAGVVTTNYCGVDADGNEVMVMIHYVVEADGTHSAQTAYNITDPTSPVLLDADALSTITLDTECCAEEAVVEPESTGFDLREFMAANADADQPENTKVNLDDSAFTNAYFDVGAAGWSTADLINALNANAAAAVPPTVPSGIDYSATVFAAHASIADVIVVSSGPVPATLDLVSLNTSFPISNAIS